MKNRPRYFSLFGPCELRVEQIGPSLWHGALYELVKVSILIHDDAGNVTGTGEHRGANWDTFGCLSEECAKRCARATAEKLLMNRRVDASSFNTSWVDCSDMTEEKWAEQLKSRQFPGYWERDGCAMFPELA